MKPITSNGRNQTLGPHPEEAALLRARLMDEIDMIRCKRFAEDHGLPPYSAGAAAGIGCSSVAPSSMPGCSGRRLPSHLETTAAATELPTTLVALRPMSRNWSIPIDEQQPSLRNVER